MRRILCVPLAFSGCLETHSVMLDESLPGLSDTPVPLPPPGPAPSYLLFEAAPVRPLALTPNGRRLLLANTPDDRLEVFDVAADGSLRHFSSIAVGMRPVSVAAASNDEVYVVNHLSDSVSVVSLSAGAVTRTLLVGDEPRDIVLAGPGRRRLFVTTAHRGQHRSDPSLAAVPGAGDPLLTTAGVSRADVWVFDADAPGNAVGGVPLAIVELFGDTPRGLAVSPDGATVYAGIFHSGNQTTTVAEQLVCDGFGQAGLCPGDGRTMQGGLPNGQMPGGNPGPRANHDAVPAPEVGLIVHFDDATGIWTDELGRNWNNGVRFSLPDRDVFAIDASALTVLESWRHVSTTLFNLEVNPINEKVYVSGTNANNATRFEGPGGSGTTVRGNLARAGIAIVDPVADTVARRGLNTHIDYDVVPSPPGIEEHSLATPTQIVFSADGATTYVAAFGSSKVGVLSTAALDAGTLDPLADSADYVDVSGGGPAGLALHPTLNRLYVSTFFDDGVSVIDTAAGVEIAHHQVHTPEDATITDGRPVLYDAVATSSNGEASCSSCHLFGDNDALAWDLGNPDGDVGYNPLTIEFEANARPDVNGNGDARAFHPMKGPMVTQTLRGLAFTGAMHWRGDRADGYFGQDPLDERLSFENFIVAFSGLLGDDMPENDPIRLAQMDRLTDFALELTLPPNPVRNIDNVLTPDQQGGLAFFDGPRQADGAPGAGFTCEGCHTLDPAAGSFGADGRASMDGITQVMKIPHLRNAYTKIGMFGRAETDLFLSENYGFQGQQIRGFGFGHDGAVDTLFRHLQAKLFEDKGVGTGIPSDAVRRQIEQYVLAFDTDLAPVVGQQVTVRADNLSVVRDRAQLLLQRSSAPFVSARLGGAVTECEVVARLSFGGRQVGLLFDPTTGDLQADRRNLPRIAPSSLVSYVRSSGSPATLTCVPPGSGVRNALDRDLDGAWDGDEIAAGTDPADPLSN